MNAKARKQQSGVITIFISMVMLLLITILVLTAYALSTANFRAVGNVEVRNEAISAAQWHIEAAMNQDFTVDGFDPTSLIMIETAMDFDQDGDTDFLISRQEPQCIRAMQAITPASSSVTLPGFSSGDDWNTLWEIRVQASDVATGASVVVVQGMRVLMTDVKKTNLCG